MSSSEVRDAVRDAAASQSPLRLAGRGTWLGAGRPVRATRTLSLSSHTGVVQYEPGDFTLTARAGTTLAELASATLPHRQFLALDPYGDPNGTLGATVATGAGGPMAYAFGGPRDNVIGMEVVTGDGAIVRCGGRVVKNVAGFDLTRLFTGAWGTLGVITEVSVRLRALPAVDETYAMTVDDRLDALQRLVATIRVASVAPFAMELLSPTLATRLGVGRTSTLLVRLGGNSASIRAQRNVLATLGDVREAPTDAWSVVRAAEPSAAIVARLSTVPSRVADVWTQAREATASVSDAALIGSIGRGIVRCILPDDAHEAARSLARCDATVIFERLPGPLWTELAPSPVGDRLSRSVKQRFDPAHVLNPGLLGEDVAR
ncbi:MAG TPA: FAD-binding protein [Gemmatimonadaceae bacterium]|nr:FAD-binding protein [Gemmatimonadaceae bacterium]